jgi:hypothetical protein
MIKGTSKGLGKGKGKTPQLAIEGAEKTDAQLLEEARSKAKKMRDLAFATVANFEDALAQMKKCKYWSKAAQKDSETILVELKYVADDLKKFIGKNSDDLELWKGKIMYCAVSVKKGTNQIKELKMIAAKTGSVATGHTASKSKK